MPARRKKSVNDIRRQQWKLAVRAYAQGRTRLGDKINDIGWRMQDNIKNMKSYKNAEVLPDMTDPDFGGYYSRERAILANEADEKRDNRKYSSNSYRGINAG